MKRAFMLLALLLMVQGSMAEEEKSLPKKIGDGVKKGGEAAGRGIEKGADATVKGLKKAGEWVGKKMQKGGEKLEKESK
ncbi:hypothetical protein MIZ01_1878 [Sideroxyarcus emersonii]|uniref:Uncharacterized protein n=1 Tax=Sideroxyarcus emersonii TaxID=2764705 RepID=A0AAN1XB34_9PROT|nr:hypothetical protein [Sideroxyarcus emersonii]BCK88078.1 hypothetical protein MIZ01_1878 [Sideroxyarcus emersonii]